MATEVFNKEKFALLELPTRISGQFDLFICAASYEKRCLSIPFNIPTDSNAKILILKNEDVAGAGNVHSQNLMDHFLGKASIIEITKTIAIKTADRIATEITGLGLTSASRICVDTTCMTHETLLILFSLFKYIFEIEYKEIQYLYCPAKEYDPGTPDEYKWLSQGIKDVRSVLGYPGKLLPSRKNRLLILVGFEVHRASGLIDVYEPASLGLGYGDDTLNHHHQQINLQKIDQLQKTYPNAEKFEFSSSDAYVVRDLILNDLNQHGEFNLIVAPMNSKISTIGAALAVLEKPEIQLCYAPAATYNFANYSEPDNCCIAFKV
jgi:hypothetical protein